MAPEKTTIKSVQKRDKLVMFSITHRSDALFLSLSAGDNGLLVCRLDNSALAVEKESRLLLYQDMDPDLDNLSCTERLARAYFTSKEPADAKMKR